MPAYVDRKFKNGSDMFWDQNEDIPMHKVSETLICTEKEAKVTVP